MLLKRQKNIIKEYFKEDLLDETNVDYYGNYNEMYRKVESIRDCETLSQDIRNYIRDLEMEVL